MQLLSRCFRSTGLMLVVLALALAGQAFGQSTVPVLVAHWTGDVDGTTVLDASGNGYSGTLYGATSVDDGIDGGRAFYFGGDDYLVIDQRLSFAQEDYTVEGWFNTGVTPHTNVYQAVFAASTWGDRSSHGVYVALQGRSWGGTTGPGSLRYLHRPIGGSSGGLDIISGFSVADGEWHHFAATRIGTHNTLYIDGAIVEDFYFNEDLGPRGSQVFSSDWPENVGFDVEVCLGRLTAGLPYRYFNGLIDEVRVYNYGLTEDEIGDIVDPPPNQPPVTSAATPSIGTLWPPNNKMVDIAIENVSDPDGDELTITIGTITDDEGSDPSDASGTGTATAAVRAQRNGKGDGRIYTIAFTVSDGTATVEGSVQVTVPHDQRKKTSTKKGSRKPLAGVEAMSWGDIKQLVR